MHVFLFTCCFCYVVSAYNLLCTIVKTYKSTDQLTKCIVTFVQEGIQLYLHWSNSRSVHNNEHAVPFANSHFPLLCPFKANAILVEVIPGDAKSSPMSIPSIDCSNFFGSSHREQHFKLFSIL